MWLFSLGKWVRKGTAALHRWLSARRRLRYERVEEFPDPLEPSTLYVAGEEPHIWAAAMLCPCGCNDVIQLNLLKQASPSWNVQHHSDGSVSLMPSVWRTKGCRSHFFVRNSRIDWCRGGHQSSDNGSPHRDKPQISGQL